LRWINAKTPKSLQTLRMVRFDKHLLDSSAAPPPCPDTAGNAIAAVQVVAAWPAGASQLAIAADVCQRSKDVEVRRDWVAAARN
jgi:hypothetical protein